ncbi:hypothetical protein AVL63_12385 [Nesterenkonia jeotgali]|uniref:IPT/TIG domain-containing protein n=1 Tax=Nesterenkonia jeotgali TaxID=317018 RepID=A0A0W8IIL7_9MICC|nr:hypothetical protein AVL63_12385 [Nesterenkonia jeotgali]
MPEQRLVPSAIRGRSRWVVRESSRPNADLSLTPLLTGTEAESILSALSLNLGAVSSSAEQLDGGAATTDYDIAGATLNFSSPLVQAVYGDLQTTVEELQTDVAGLSESISGGLASVELGSVATLNSEVTVVPPDLSEVLPAEVIGTSSGVTVDLTSGAVTVDLAALLAANPELPDLNNLGPNSPLLSAGVTAAIADGITQAVTDAVSPLVENLENAIQAASVDVDVTIDALLIGEIAVTLDATVQELLAGEATAVFAEGQEGPVGELVSALGLGSSDALLNSIVNAVTGSLGTAVDEVIEAEGTLDDITGSLAAEVVGPVLTLVNELVAVTVNVQPATGDLGAASTTVRALQVAVLPAAPLATVNLASSTVRGTGTEVPVFDPSIGVDPSEVEQGSSTTVTGEGFAPEESVTVSIPGVDGGDPVAVETTTNTEGEFVVDLPVPGDYPTGDVEVTAEGAQSQTPATAGLVVLAPGEDGDDDDDDDTDEAEVDPSLGVEPDSAAPGDEVTIEGDDFVPGSTVDIVITDEDGDVIGTIEDVQVDEDGDFSQDWTVPEGTDPGDLTIIAEDDEGNSAEAILVIVDGTGPDGDEGPDGDGDNGAGDDGAGDDGAGDNGADGDNGAGGGGDDGALDPGVSIDPDAAEPGETVTIEGDDFTPGGTVIIEIVDEGGNTVGTIDDVQVGDDGSFLVDWTLPADLSPGQLVVTATDDAGNAGSGILDVLDRDGAGGVRDGEGDATPAGAGEGSDRSGGLAATGATVATFGVTALVLTLLGAVLYMVSRHRRFAEGG